MMDTKTQQFMYYCFAVLVCIVVASIFGFIFAVAWREGDGEAIRMAEALAPVAIAVFLSIGGVLGLHTTQSASVAKAQIAANATAGVTSPSVPGFAGIASMSAPSSAAATGVPPMSVADVVQQFANLP